MRRSGVGICALVLLGACNQILGNDDEHHLIADLDPGGGSDNSAGTGGSAGSSAQGGKSNGTGGKTSSSGTTSDAGAGAAAPVGGETGAGGAEDVGPCDCVPAPSGAALGYFPAPGAMCEAGYDEITLHQGLSSPSECTGCTCTPATADCDAGVIAHQTGTCPGFQTTGLLYNVFGSGCQPVTVNSTSVHHYSIRGLAECTAGGVGVPAPASWTATRTFCQLKTGAGCASGSLCVPTGMSTDDASCTRLSGTQACDPGLGTAMGSAWSPGFTDERTCSCQCSFGISGCGNARIQLFSQANCQGTSTYLGSGSGAEGDVCTLPFTPQSGIITGGLPGTNECPVNQFAIGEATPDSPRTICCR
jgi:hypothetical protein